MATKPTDQPELWASNALYTTGPFIGSSSKVVPPGAIAAEGHRPGAAYPTPAEYENSQQNRITALCQWVFAGSSAGAADAHIVETDSTGRATLHGLTVDDAANETAVSILGVSTVQPTVQITNTSGGTALTADIGNAFASCITASVGTGNGAAFDAFLNGTVPGGAGLRVSATGATTASGIVVNHAGPGTGVAVTASGAGRGFTVVGGTGDVAIVVTGGAGQGAIMATSGNSATAAIGALGVGTAYGIDAQGGLLSGSADAIRGSALNANAAGVRGRSAAGAGSGAGVLGEGVGVGQIGVYGTAAAGYAFLFQGDATPPLYPIGRFVPQTVDPTASTSTGDFTISVQNQFRYCVAGFGYKPFMTMPTTGSAVLGIATLQAGTLVSYGTGAFSTVVLTVSCLASQGNGFYSTLAGNTVRIRFTGDVKTLTAATTTANVQLQDYTLGGAGVPITTWQTAGTGASNGFLLPNATTEWQRTIVCEVTYPPPADGDLVIRVLMSSTLNNQAIRNARLEVIGSF